MFKKFLSLCGIIIGCNSSFIIAPVNAAKDPYIYAYISFGINYCAREYGIFRDDEAYENVNQFMKDEFNMAPWQVYNIIQRKGFYKDSLAYVKSKGGCSVIAAELTDRINAQPRGFSGLKNKKGSKNYIYKID